MSKRGQAGDTIVEVLLAILVVSTILGGAFVSARRSQTGIRQTEERVEALKVAEAQIERIRTLSKSSSGTALFTPTAPYTFCVDTTNQLRVATLNPLTTDNFSNGTQHPSGCNTAPAGGVTYYTVAQRAADNTFTVYTRWNGSGGSGKLEVQLSVRLDP